MSGGWLVVQISPMITIEGNVTQFSTDLTLRMIVGMRGPSILKRWGLRFAKDARLISRKIRLRLIIGWRE